MLPFTITYGATSWSQTTEELLTEKDEGQKASNKEKSKTRVRVEHIFGFVENSMNGSFVRTIGLARAKTKIGGGVKCGF